MSLILNAMGTMIGLSEEEIEKIIINALAEFSRHEIDPAETQLERQVDAWVDILYYALDSFQRLRIKPEPSNEVLVLYREGETEMMRRELEVMWEQVGAFTHGVTPADAPRPDARKQFIFLTTMILSEMLEASDFVPGSDEAEGYLRHYATVHLQLRPQQDWSEAGTANICSMLLFQILSQAKQVWPGRAEGGGKNLLSAAFDEVHAANMRKGKLVDGVHVFSTKMVGETRKIIKPEGWVGPDITSVVTTWALSQWRGEVRER